MPVRTAGIHTLYLKHKTNIRNNKINWVLPSILELTVRLINILYVFDVTFIISIHLDVFSNRIAFS